MKGHEVELRLLTSEYMAVLKDDLPRWGCGRSEAEAVGTMMLSHARRLGIRFVGVGLTAGSEIQDGHETATVVVTEAPRCKGDKWYSASTYGKGDEGHGDTIVAAIGDLAFTRRDAFGLTITRQNESYDIGRSRKLPAD